MSSNLTGCSVASQRAFCSWLDPARARSMNASVMELTRGEPTQTIDSDDFGRYTVLAAAKSVAGIGVPELTIAHNRAYAVFLCAMHCYIQFMVGRAGQSSDWPVSVVTGYANPVRLTTFEIGVSGGGLSKPTIEAAIMATIRALAPPEITVVNGHAVTSSLAIADYFTKRHDDVLKKIRALECSPEFNARNFAEVEYIDAKGERRPAYQITRDGFAFLAMGFTGKRAARFKEAYITAFSSMERALIGRSRQKDSGLEPILFHAQRMHENLSIIMSIWADNVQPLNPPIVVSGTIMDAYHRSRLIAELVDIALNSKHNGGRK